MKPYNLIALAGESPQVITETVWALARSGRIPARLVIVTTCIGEAHCRARLLGEARRHPVKGGDIPTSRHWPELCESLGLSHVPDVRFIVPRHHGEELQDIAGPGADQRFAEACFEAVSDLTGDDDLALVGSMAGGRKTMSAHLLTAFSVHARPQDELVHVLVHPPSFERGSFFYPTQEDANDVEVRLVKVRFPRLRELLASKIGDGQSPPDLASIFRSTDPWYDPEHPPRRVTIRPDGNCFRLDVLDSRGDVIQNMTLAPAKAATLAVLLQHTIDSERGVRPQALFAKKDPKDHGVHALRLAIVGYCGLESLKPWDEPADVSKAINALTTDLIKSPAFSALFTFVREPAANGPIFWRPSHAVEVDFDIDTNTLSGRLRAEQSTAR